MAVAAVAVTPAPSAGMAQQPADDARFQLGGLEVRVVGEPAPFQVTVETRMVEAGVEVATVRLTASEPRTPGPLSLEWSLPSHDVAGLWTTAAGFDKGIHADWAMSGVRSMLAQNAPVISLFGGDDGNRLTFAVSDALNTVRLRAGVREEDGRIYAGVDLFTEPHGAVGAFELELRFDSRPVPFFQSLNEVARWWATHDGYEPASVPEAARLPMYSTWYSYHQSLDPEPLLEEVEIAAGLGYEAIIVDDGWQTLDSKRGYAFTGDWEPERIPDMKAFVDGVHERGMRFLLWYAVPLVGERSRIFSRFKGKYLRYWEGQGAWELDPRYPDVREHIIDTYRTAMRTWGVDGFKLDFLGRFVANESTDLTLADGRDFASVNDATDRLMTDILAELRRLDPDVMIEFRQPYIGPLMRKYGNMFRAGDAPNAIARHRVRVVDLRLLSGSTAVHSDMLMWHYDEPTEVAALQFLNVMFSVPQMSVRLAGVPADQLEMIGYYTDYWRRNRSVLLDGDFAAFGPLANYPLLIGHDGQKQILGLYGNVVAPLDSSRPTGRIDVLNGRSADHVVLDVTGDLGTYRFTVLDVRGRIVDTGQSTLTDGAHRFRVPVAGMLTLERQ